MSRLLEFGRKECSFYNWDVQGAMSISESVFTSAENIIARYDLENKPDVKVYYYSRGTIGFEWTCVHGLVDVEVDVREYEIMITNGSRIVMEYTAKF